ncbi:MAG: class I SAM-dependent methyltransferase [bacterium]
MSVNTADISFEKLPLWSGVKGSPGAFGSLPFSVGWGKKGFIAQTTSQEIKNKIVHSYAVEGYSYGTKPPGFSKWSDKLGDTKYNFVKQVYGSLDGINVVEIGAGSLNIAQRLTSEYNINKYIVFDPAIKDSLTKENIHVFRDYFKKGKIRNEHYDLVLGFSVLEHIPEPVELLRDLYAVLAPSRGRAVFSFPDIEQQFKNGDFNSLLHEHFNYFTMSTATSLFNRCGFNVLESESKTDTLWYYLEAARNNSSSEILADKGSFNVSTENFYRNIKSVACSLNELQAQGKIIALHGACNGLNNILFLTGMGNSENLLIFDSDQTKAGKYLPASSVPIRFFEDALYRTADKVFIAALSYYSEIKESLIKKHKISASQIQPIY